MHAIRTSVRRGALLTGLYFAGAVIAVFYLRTPADVTLFWPAAGIGYAIVLRYGLPYVLVIALAQLLLHLIFVPVSTAFLPFSVISNALATLVACAYVQHRKRVLEFRLHDGLLLMRGGLLLCAVSAGIGILGMAYAGMILQDAMASAFLQWALGDLLGVTSVTPALLFLFNINRRNTAHPMPTEGSKRERFVWAVALLAVLTLVFTAAHVGTMYPMALASLPLALLLWSTGRYPPIFTAFATMVAIIFLALVYGLGLGGFERPESTLDTALMMGALTVYSVIPMLLMATSQERFNAMSELHIRATRDPLTGLLNRDTFKEQAQLQLTRESGVMTLLYTDLDHFKLVNDSGTHVAGDEMIRNVASLVQAEFSDSLVARTGGDEFAVLAPLDAAAATTRARRLLSAIEAVRIAWQGQNLGTTASIGLSTSQPSHMTFDELFSQADIACFEAKELGGNRWFATSPDTDGLQDRTRLMRGAVAAREALDQRRFELWCQPIVDLHNPGQIQDHFEVLLRWRDKDGNLRPPAEMIAAAERYRLGPRLDRYVLDSMLAWLESHPAAAAQVRQCSINLGATTLVDEDFGDYFASRLRRSSIRPEQFCLEITETSVVRDMTRTRRFINRIRDLGCSFALDDFGTGFCSFSYLRDLDVDYLKIDGSFVRELDGNHAEGGSLSEAVVRSITEIAHVLGKRAVGEQAETHRQLEFLRTLGVDFAQGYIFQRPMPIDDFFAVAKAA